MQETNSNGSSIKGVFLAFAAGAAVGAGIALLYAPKSGKETRELLSRKTRDLKEAAGNAMGRAKQRAREALEEGRQTARESVREFNEATQST
jgi:gas vesicle protein